MPILKIMRLCLLILINFVLAACSHVAGNIVPEGGPTMESIYDGLDDKVVDSTSDKIPVLSNEKLGEKRGSPQQQKSGIATTSYDFYTLPNPQLTLYILPHLAGTEELPIPGYWTAFSAYPRTLYALPQAVKDSESRGNP